MAAMHALRLALLVWLTLTASALAQTAPVQRPPPPPVVAAPAPVASSARAAPKAASTLVGGGLATSMSGLQSFAANGSFLKGLNPGDPAPQCRARCGSDRAFCGAGGGDDGCDGVWRQCLSACRTAK